MKDYELKNHDTFITRKKIYSKNRFQLDNNFRLVCGTRSRIHQFLGGKKSNSTEENLVVDIDTCRKWIEYQFTPEMN